MLLSWPGYSWLTSFLLVLGPVPGRSADPSDPLRFVPDVADLVIKIERPANLARTLYELDFIQGALKLEAVREASNSTNFRRLQQLVGYFEKRFGAEKFELLDQMAGGGIVVAVKLGQQPPPVLLVIEGKEEKKTTSFLELVINLINQELSREEKKEKVVQHSRQLAGRQITTYSLGNDLHFAQVGAAVVLTNKEAALKAVLETHAGQHSSMLRHPHLAELRKLIGQQPSAWVWLNLESVRTIEGGKNFFEQPKKNPFLGVVTGGLIEIAGRSPFVCVSLQLDREQVQLAVQMPRGRQGMAAYSVPYVPPKDHRLLPPLQPNRVVYSVSIYLDLGRLFEQRKKILGENEVKNLEKAEKDVALFLGGVKLSKLLQQSGSCWRFVQTEGRTSVYKVKPGLPISPFALVVDMRDQQFGRSMETILRGVALLGAAAVNLKMVEEKHNGTTLISYRFREDVPLKNDVNNIRFNFSPCFASVGDQFLAASTVELGRELVDLLKKEETRPRTAAGSWTCLHAQGVAASLRSAETQLLTQAVLTQAITPESARKQLDEFIRLVEQLGHLHATNVYEQERTRLEIRMQLKKQP